MSEHREGFPRSDELILMGELPGPRVMLRAEGTAGAEALQEASGPESKKADGRGPGPAVGHKAASGARPFCASAAAFIIGETSHSIHVLAFKDR